MADALEADQQKNPELIRLLQSHINTESQIKPLANLAGWSNEESTCLLNLIEEYEYLAQLNLKNEQVYIKLSKFMTVGGHRKTNEEIKSHWKELKYNYEEYKAGNCDEFEYSDQMSRLLDLNSSSEPEIIIIKGEELEGNIIHSESFDNFSGDEIEPRNGRGIRRNNWTNKETECVLQVLEKYGMPSRSDLRKFCYVIVDHLKQCGYARTEEQAQVKIKHLRALHNQVRRKCIKEEEFPYFNRFEALMHSHQEQTLKEYEESHNYTSICDKSEIEDNLQVDYQEQADEEPCYKKGRQIWTNKEIRVLLSFIEENGIITGKQLRKVCNKAVEFLASYGYCRSPTQILIRWKNAKALYWSTYRKKCKIPERECSYFYRLHAILNSNDCTYETGNYDDGTIMDEDSKFYQTNETINNVDTKSNLSAFHFNEVSHNQPSFNFNRENFGILQNKSNLKENFISVENDSNMPISKRYHISSVSTDPLENSEGVGKVLAPSPKRCRSEQMENTVQVGGCLFCNTLDPIDHYCISLAHSIKKLDAKKQAKLKIEILQLMYKAEFDSDF